MNRILSAVLLVAGLLLIGWGLKVSDAFNSQVKEAFTGSPTDKAMWLYVGGGALAVAGMVGLSGCCCKK